MIKRIVITIAVLTAALLMPQTSLAKTVCSTEGDYGQKVVCWEEPDEQVLGVHEPVETDLEDSLPFIAAGALAASAGLYYISKKLEKATIFIS